MPKSPREHPQPWAVQETAVSFRIIDAESNLLAEIPFATGLGQGLSRDAAQQMAQRMLDAGDVLASKGASRPNERTG